MSSSSQQLIMKTYHISKNGNQFGPFAEEEVRRKLAIGDLNGRDLCWTDGMAQWAPIHQVMSLPPTVPPPPLGQAPHRTPHQFNDRFINWVPALVLYLVFIAYFSIAGLISLDAENGEVVGGLFLIGLPLGILAVVFVCMLHYKCWMALPQQHRFTTPGRAIGFMWIPFYNLYWAFVTWPKLSEGLIYWQSAQGVPPVNTQGLAMTYAILFVCQFAIGWIPVFGFLIGVAQIVIFIIYYLKVVGALNALLKQR